jgi:predicted alpha/beta hydrolase family esterase
MYKIIEIFGLYIGIELIHHGYLLYIINSVKNINLKRHHENKEKNFQIVKNNFFSILEDEYNINKVNNLDNLENLDIQSIYKNAKNFNFNIMDDNFIFITPYPLILRFYNTFGFIFDLFYYYCKDFDIKTSLDSIILIKNSLNPKAKLILIHTGMLGNVYKFKDIIDKLELEYSICICILRSTVNTFFWKNADIDLHINFLYKNIREYKNITIISHSFGAFAIEYMLKKIPDFANCVQKEILIQPGNVMSTGLIFLSSKYYSFVKYFNFISKYSPYTKHNFLFTWMIKSLAGKSTISSIKNIQGIRIYPRNFTGYLIISDNDPLINMNIKHPSYQEISYIFPNYKIISNNDYHGLSNKRAKLILECIYD